MLERVKNIIGKLLKKVRQVEADNAEPKNGDAKKAIVIDWASGLLDEMPLPWYLVLFRTPIKTFLLGVLSVSIDQIVESLNKGWLGGDVVHR